MVDKTSLKANKRAYFSYPALSIFGTGLMYWANSAARPSSWAWWSAMFVVGAISLAPGWIAGVLTVRGGGSGPKQSLNPIWFMPIFGTVAFASVLRNSIGVDVGLWFCGLILLGLGIGFVLGASSYAVFGSAKDLR